MPVPSAMTPKPIQIQLTSGLTKISRLADLLLRASAAPPATMYRSSASVRRIATSVVGSCSCLRKNHFAGYSVSICLPSTNTARYAVDHLLLAVVAHLHAVLRIV